MKYSYYVFIALFLSLFALLYVQITRADLEWVRGQYGSKCYYKGTEHGNIKHKVYYDSHQSCIDSLGD